ncbi:pyrroloquinoline quinone biosynthesis protein PqqC [Ktedonosporobacter rubrisoli]|uniref:Pyrroloquinoline-quinone synthase n=1 Tax=Ktedonosporobacter rubrisoli TaxID=2509675 RepID=A0A4P6JQ79_KTERU|nr:pyrroloquinoline-quinone synthase PqqC [Ktedonosporobacter rubrisoli]QBD77403.1 pyrroloquinoline quinone biosynthesis protein PqqC [Ktedonosporobacter rubrisoli]
MTIQTTPLPWDRETFLSRLQTVGMTRYHHQHPFHVAMNSGQLTPPQIRSWVANRFYYQRNIPRKDAAIIANCPLREVRRIWLHRVSDHDGFREGEGGIECWFRLAEAVGLTHSEVQDELHVLPGVRFAVDAYVQFARTKPWPIAIASSLTELFAPDLMQSRLQAFERYYSWISPSGLDYFRARIVQAATDSRQGLELTLRYCSTLQLQEEAVRALGFKCDVLWSILDALSQTATPIESSMQQEFHLRT